MAQGQCNCGAVGYETTGELRDVIVCHCSICRRYTGANGIAVLLLANADFRWLRGEDQISVWDKPDGAWQAHFCRNCGSAVPGHNTDGTTYIPAGSISNGEQHLRVAHHVFVDSRASWDVIGDDGVQHSDGLATG